MKRHELEALRRLLFFSQPEAAALIGDVGERAWRRWEEGSRTVPADVIARVSELIVARNRAISDGAGHIAFHPVPVAVVWYDTLDDFLTLAGREPAQWRPGQSIAAELAARYPERVRLIKFETPSYAGWLAGRADNEAMRAAWAAEQIRGAQA